MKIMIRLGKNHNCLNKAIFIIASFIYRKLYEITLE